MTRRAVVLLSALALLLAGGVGYVVTADGSPEVPRLHAIEVEHGDSGSVDADSGASESR